MNTTFKILLLLFLTGLVFPGCKKSDTSPHGQLPEKTYELKGGASFSNGGKSVTFRLNAPDKESVYVIGDFNDWQEDPDYKMTESGNGKWELTVDGLNPSKQYGYQYLIDHTIRIADPYAHEILDPDNDSYISSNIFPNLKKYPHWNTMGYISVIQAKKKRYEWKTTDFVAPEENDLVVYELLVRDFSEAKSFKGVIDRLDYLENLGINAIELLPVNEFEGNNSWGYDPIFMMALDKAYGTQYDYKRLIDECHKRGIAIIQDIVLHDQFGSSPLIKMYANSAGTPSEDNPYFYTHNRHPYAVGYQMKQYTDATKDYVKDVMKYWVKEFHIDGFRFDQGKAFSDKDCGEDNGCWSSYDPNRAERLIGFHDYLKSLNSDFYMILEFFADQQERNQVIDHGLIVWNNMNYNAGQATMGYDDSDLSGIFFRSNGLPDNTQGGLLTFFESHDEERLQFENEENGNSSGSYDVKDLTTGLERDGMAAVFLLTAPGPKMLWQFQERGYDISIDDGGRLSEKDPHWEYMDDPDRKKLYDVFSQMIHFKTNNEIFKTSSYDYDVSGKIKWINLYDGGEATVQAVGNFDLESHSVDLQFHKAGTWYDNFSDKKIEVPEEDPEKVFTLDFAPGQYYLFSRGSLLK